jgi:hypothetical protein
MNAQTHARRRREGFNFEFPRCSHKFPCQAPRESGGPRHGNRVVQHHLLLGHGTQERFSVELSGANENLFSLRARGRYGMPVRLLPTCLAPIHDEDNDATATRAGGVNPLLFTSRLVDPWIIVRFTDTADWTGLGFRV